MGESSVMVKNLQRQVGNVKKPANYNGLRNSVNYQGSHSQMMKSTDLLHY